MADFDRRRDPNPQPPDGIEHRRCSDKTCRDAREEWLIQEVMPKMMLRFGGMIMAAVTLLSGIFLYMSKNAIRDFALEAKSQYVSVPLHMSDISRIERKVDAIESNLSDQLQDISEKIDRNFATSRVPLH